MKVIVPKSYVHILGDMVIAGVEGQFNKCLVITTVAQKKKSQLTNSWGRFSTIKHTSISFHAYWPLLTLRNPQDPPGW